MMLQLYSICQWETVPFLGKKNMRDVVVRITEEIILGKTDVFYMDSCGGV